MGSKIQPLKQNQTNINIPKLYQLQYNQNQTPTPTSQIRYQLAHLALCQDFENQRF